jgi:hypothetical protein
MSIKMASMSSGIAFPRQFNFQQLANARKLNAGAKTTISDDSISEVDDLAPAPKSFAAPSTTAATTAPNPFFARKPSILSSIPETPVVPAVASSAIPFGTSGSFGRGDDDDDEASSKKSSRKSDSDDDDEDYYKRYNIPEPGEEEDSYSRRSSRSGHSRRSGRSSHRSGHSSRSGHSRRSSRRSDDEEDDHSRSSQPFKDTYDVQMHKKTAEPMTREEYRRKQIDLIMSLRQMKEDGIPVDDDVRLEQSTPLEKLEFAYEYSQRYVIRQATFNSFQRYLVMGAQLAEVGNKIVKAKTGKGAELDGWSSSVMMNMPQFNYPLQRMAVKYSGTSENSPEMELAMALGWSALSFHMAKKASTDPQVAAQFMSYMQQSRGGNATPGMDPLMSGMPGGPAVGTTTEPTQTSAPLANPLSSPMGLRPPVASNTRSIPLFRGGRDDDSDVEESETTEEFRV